MICSVPEFLDGNTNKSRIQLDELFQHRLWYQQEYFQIFRIVLSCLHKRA